MTAIRRNNDRRRRVLYYSQQSDGTASAAVTRRELQRLREARRPTALYAERVQRRLQGRWFSLVPVQMRTFTLVAGISVAMTTLLVILHYLSVTWSPLAYRAEIARPLRLDHADSFGRWFLTFLLAGGAGVCLMIYQLRRYRIDDYLGRYRLWRLVLITLAIASVGVSVSLVSWTGSLLDLAFGKRVALAGADWIRLLVSIGGGILVLRLIAEVYQCRIALAGVLCGAFFMMIPEAAGWNLFVVNSPFRWSIVTSAPLLAATAWWIGLGGYLRALHREVCEIEAGPSLRERLVQMNLGVFRKEAQSETEKSEKSKVEARDEEDRMEATDPKPRWWNRLGRSKNKEDLAENTTESEPEPPQADSPEPASPTAPKRKKRRFGLGLRLQPPITATDDDAPEPDAAPEDSADESARKPRRGLGGFLKRREPTGKAPEVTTTNVPEPDPPPPAKVESPTAPVNTEGGAAEGDLLDPDSIDWSSLSKSERRRLRKQLKRQNRAA